MSNKFNQIKNLIGLFIIIFLISDLKSQITLPNKEIVPKERFIVYICIGHSNMAGRTGKLDTVIHKRAWNFFINDELQPYSNHSWIPAKAPIHRDHNKSGGGPGMHFLKNMVTIFPNHYFGLVQNATSGAFCKIQYNPNISNNYYSEMIEALEKIKEKVTFGGIICMLGIAESYSPDIKYSQSLLNDLKIMVKSFRDTLNLPELPFIICEHEYDVPSEDWLPHCEISKKEILKVPANIPFSAIVPTKNLEYDIRWHYTYKGYEDLTIRMASIIKSKNYFPAVFNLDPNKIIEGKRFTINDTLNIEWTANEKLVNDAVLYLSHDDGKTWNPMVGVIHKSDTNWGKLKWVIPEKFFGTKLLNKECILKISDYNMQYFDCLENALYIVSTVNIFTHFSQTVSDNGKCFKILSNSNNKLHLNISLNENYDFSFINLRGKTIITIRGSRPDKYLIDLKNISSGPYLFRLSTYTEHFQQMIFLNK